jgi:hypothetical protein
MIDKKKLKQLALEVLKQLDEYEKARDNYFDSGARKAITLLIVELDKNVDVIPERILRAMQDIGVSGVKDYEETPLGDAIGLLTSELYYSIPYYKNLHVLGMDFGKGDPI